MLRNIHPKVQASGAVGIPVSLIVEILTAFGVHLPATAIVPLLTLLMLAAGYLAPSHKDPFGS